MSKVPDAWEDEWSAVADAPTPSQEGAEEEEPKRISSKVTKAQKRAQQAEFNRQLWAEAEGPKQTNFFLESRNVVPLRQEFKPPPVLLSRKGPKPLSRPKPPPGVDGIANLSILSNNNAESSEDEDEELAKQSALEARKLLAAKEREEKQRKYEERRLELFGPQTQSNGGRPTSRSGNSSPGSSTPPQSRSSTPGSNQRGKRGRGGRGGSQLGGQVQLQPRIQQRELLYDQSYSPKPDSAYVQRQEREGTTTRPIAIGIQPIRAPRGPDGSGRGGFGFANRGGRLQDATNESSEPLPLA